MNPRNTTINTALGLLVLAAGLFNVACGTSESLSGPSMTTGGPGVTIQGTVNGGAGATSVASAPSAKAAGLKVSVVTTSLSTTTNDRGQFMLTGAPHGRVILRFEGPGVDASVELPGLVSGQTITIEVNAAGNRAVTASSAAEFTGPVGSIGASSLSVSGITVLVSPTTEIERGGARIALSDIKIGETVEVEGTLNPDGTVAAREIKAAGGSPSPTPTPSATPSPGATPTPRATPSPSPTPSGGSPIEFSGTIGGVGAASLVISGRTVTVNASTEIRRNDAKVGLADLKVGDAAKVEGILLDNGDVLAREIKATSAPSPGGADVKFTGTVQSIAPPNSLMVGGTRVVVNGSTVIPKGGLAGLQVGQRVEVEGTTQGDGSVLARKIEVDK